MRCLTSARMNMMVDVLRQAEHDAENIDISEQGKHVIVQNTRTGQLERKWVPLVEGDPAPSDPDSYVPPKISIPCTFQGVIDGGIRVAGTTERFDKSYDNVDFAKMVIPEYYKGKRIVLSKRDRITNVRNKKTGRVIWVEEELDANNGVYPPTVFDVLGVTPVPIPMTDAVEYHVLLARVDLNGNS